MKTYLKKVIEHFQITGTFESGHSFGSGHINETYLIRTHEKDQNDYILQRVNHHVFQNVPALQENINRVTTHVKNKLEQIPGSQPRRETLTLVPAVDDKSYYYDDEGNYWRVYMYIDHHRSYDRVESAHQAYEGGKTFGRFQYFISDLPGPPLNETIPNFHNMDTRLATFFKTVESNPKNRVGSAREEIRFVEQRAEEMTRILRLGQAKSIPERITHNDTKFNNVLFDENDRGLCVVDLDTIMPGFIHYDFGDSIRTSSNTGMEDDPDLSKVELDLNLFEAYSKGFLSQTHSFLTHTEIENLAFSGKMMTFIMGLRFLTDYLDGDHYYKIHSKEHNLQRAKAQFKLVSSMERQYDSMQKIIERIVQGNS